MSKMEKMLSHLNEFSISSEEVVLGLNDVLVDEGKEGVCHGLLGKLLMQKAIQFDVFKEMFGECNRGWRPKGLGVIYFCSISTMMLITNIFASTNCGFLIKSYCS